MNNDELRLIAEEQMDKFEETGEKEGLISFEFEGIDIINPFVDETGRFEVDPQAYYGEAYLKSDWIIKSERVIFKKRLKIMVDAAIVVSEAWEDLDEEFETLVIENYPFKRDFSEIIKKMIEWNSKIERK